MHGLLLILISLVSYCSVASEEQNPDYFNQYTGYSIYYATPKNEAQLEFLDSIQYDPRFSFWQNIPDINSTIAIVAGKENKQVLEDLLKDNGIEFEITVDNIAKLLREQFGLSPTKCSAPRRKRDVAFDFTKYNTLTDIYSWMRLKESTNSEYVSIELIGNSTENREIPVLKISRPNDKPEKVILIIAGIFGRDWLSVASLLHIANTLIENTLVYDNLLAKSSFYIIPVLNPDGYFNTWTINRNQSVNNYNDSTCPGFNINRNFDAQWGLYDSTKICSCQYPGPAPFTNETVLLRDFITKYKNSISAYIDFYTFGQRWMFPRASSVNLPAEDKANLAAAAKAAADAIGVTNLGTFPYTPNQYSVAYPKLASGTIMDYVYDSNISYAFTVQMRDTKQAFLHSPSNIVPSGTELFAAIEAVHNYIFN